MCMHVFSSTVNRPCNGKSSHMTVRTASTDIRRPAPLERTVFSRETKKLGAKQPLRSQPGQARDAAYMRALKEQFQRDIDDTVAQILSEGVSVSIYLYATVFVFYCGPSPLS